ncbi:hypothetical protein Bca101_021304 [Brassica carinata]
MAGGDTSLRPLQPSSPAELNNNIQGSTVAANATTVRRNTSVSELQSSSMFVAPDESTRPIIALAKSQGKLSSDSATGVLQNISMWVSTALSHCLRELDITRVSHSSAKPIVLPSNLYTCKSLVVLKLKGDILFDVPGMFSLPSLKTLVISVRYLSEETRQRLLSNCPILEDLVLGLRDGDTTGKLTLVVPSLLRLTLFLSKGLEIDGYVIETPALKYFKLVDHSSNDHYCLIENMPCLIEAYLDCGSHDINIVIGSITSVKRLTICCSETMLDEGCVFNQLEHLEVCICKEHFSNQLFQLLKASSNLQGLCLYYMDGHHYEFIGHWNQPTTIPECISLSLQSFSWWNYTGIPEEREILVYILKHARHLKTATIKSSQSPRVPESEMLKELELSSRASAACQLMHPGLFSTDTNAFDSSGSLPILFDSYNVAVSTSLLSKRWEYLWMWLPKLEFCHRRISTCGFYQLFLTAYDPLGCSPNGFSSLSENSATSEGDLLFSAETLQRLVSNCPVLEDLVVYLRDHDSTRKLSVVLPSFQSLTLYIPYNNEIDGYMLDSTISKSLIGSITSVKRLAICRSQAICDDCLVFNQLEHLEVCACTVLFSNQLVRLLKASSKVISLEVRTTGTVPECMMSSLQSLSWSKYTGKPQERVIVVYILKHALHLKTATITPTESAVRKHEMLKELSRSSRASAACQLMFE